MPKEIKLYNRDGANLCLKPLNEDSVDDDRAYILSVDKEHSFVLDYMRIIGNFIVKNKLTNWLSIEAVDPSGGPYLCIGKRVTEHHKISRIVDTPSYGKVFILEEINETVD